MIPLVLAVLAAGFPHPEFWAPSGPTVWRAQLSAGYSHYDAADLNRTLQLLENLTREAAGTNPYAVSGFDGHPAFQGRFGLRRGPWNLDLELESWSETFEQTEVPFDLEDNDRNDRITCDDLRANAANLTQLAGCIEAEETFVFLPITLQLAWMPQWKPWLRAGIGYGVGVLAGSAEVTMRSTYFGDQAAPSDEITFSIQPDPLVNPVHKFFTSVEWKPTRRFGMEFRGGYRLTSLQSFVLSDKSGSSQVFDQAFDFPEEGDHLWIQSPGENPEVQTIWIGGEFEARARSSRYTYHPVQGDFDGWFAAVAVLFEWGAR